MIRVVQACICFNLIKTKKSTMTGSFLNVCDPVPFIQGQPTSCQQGDTI